MKLKLDSEKERRKNKGVQQHCCYIEGIYKYFSLMSSSHKILSKKINEGLHAWIKVSRKKKKCVDENWKGKLAGRDRRQENEELTGILMGLKCEGENASEIKAKKSQEGGKSKQNKRGKFLNARCRITKLKLNWTVKSAKNWTGKKENFFSKKIRF